MLLYEMASGQMPFKGASIFELCSAILEGTPLPLPDHVPEPLSKITYRCLRKEIGRRYQHVSEIKAALEVIEPNSGHLSSRPYRGVTPHCRLSARSQYYLCRIFRTIPSRNILRMASPSR